MDKDIILDQIKKCSNKLSKETEDCNQKHNQHMQDFIIWLKGYLDGAENQK